MEDVPPQQRLWPAAIDYRAKQTPDRVFALLPKGQTLEDGFFDLTYANLAKAIDATAWWLDDVLGAKPARTKFESFETVPYIGEDDFRYILILFAAQKTGRRILLPFPANTAEGIVRLLELTQSTVAFASKSHMHVWTEPLRQKPEVKLFEVPEIEEWMHDRPVKPYPFTRTAEAGGEDPVFVIQTSGTTGTPKPIYLNVRFFSHYVEKEATWSSSSGGDKIALWTLVMDSYCPVLVPLSWMVGTGGGTFLPLYTTSVHIFMPRDSRHPYTPQDFDRVNRLAPRGKKNGVLVTPDMLRLAVREERFRESLKRYDWVGYAGAPLGHETGDVITAMGVRVQSLIGSTDTGIYGLMLNDAEDWKIHRFSKALQEMEGFFLEQYQDDLYELCVKRQDKDPRHLFAGQSDLQVGHTRDLWRQVKGRKGFWANAGRVDDFVKLASMTKFNAINMEQIVEGHREVTKCVIGGDARTKPFILVEPSADVRADSSSQEAIVKKVWPAIEAANEHVLPEARLTKELLLLTDVDRPVPLTAKGTVQRRTVLEMYEEAIDEAYSSAGYEAVPFRVNGEVDLHVNGHVNGRKNGHANGQLK